MLWIFQGVQVFCIGSEPILLASVGQVALTTWSIPSMLAVPAYLTLFGWLSVKNRLAGWVDLLLLAVLTTAVVLFGAHSPLKNGSFGLAGFSLIWPFLLFFVGYGIWRLAGRRPLARWPWYRFGLLVTMTLLMGDIGVAITSAPPNGGLWQLGGACVEDALVTAPPLLTLIFFGLLDCRSFWVFCSRKCRDLNRCRFGMDGKRCDCVRVASGAPDESEPKPLAWWGRGVLSVVAGILIIFGYSAIPYEQVVYRQADASPSQRALIGSAQSEGLRIAEAYRIPAPKIEFLESAVPGLTRPPIRAGEASTIELSSAVLQGRFKEDPALLRAVVAHEVGHAIQNARGTGFPTLLVLLMYVCSLAVVLFAFPHGRGIFLWGGFLLGLLALLSYFPGLHAHAALRAVLIGQALAAAVLWRRQVSIREVLPARIAGLTNLWPAPGSLAAAALAGVVTFFALGIYLGSKNVERELIADQVAACEVGAGPIRAALMELRGNSKKEGDISARLFDPFHPLLAERLAAIEALQHAGRLKVDCDAMRKGD